MNPTPLTTPERLQPDPAPLDEQPKTPVTMKELAQKLAPDVTALNQKAEQELAAFRALPRWQRIKIIARKFWIKGWAKLGFGLRPFPRPPLDKRFARDYIATETRIKLRFYERLQLIISGRIVFRQSMMTHPRVKRSASMSALSILPPGVE